jgi:hypothetical protein
VLGRSSGSKTAPVTDCSDRFFLVSDAVPPPTWSGPPGRQIPDDITGVFYRKGITILLMIVTLGIWGFFWSYHTGEDLKRYNGDGLGGLVNVLIYLVLSVVLMFTIPYEISNMYTRDGQRSPVSTLWGLWFLLPIIGHLVWYFKVQDALNDFWRAKGSRTV